VKGAGTDFNVVGLQQYAALITPEVLQSQDHFLKHRALTRTHGHGNRPQLLKERTILQGFLELTKPV
jgi:hypothetical protein